jgi:DNA protecting protein DprA
MELNDEARARIQLHGIRRLGAVAARQWMRKLGGAEAVVKAPRDVLAALGAGPELTAEVVDVESRLRADREIELAVRHGIDFYFPVDEGEGDIVSTGTRFSLSAMPMASTQPSAGADPGPTTLGPTTLRLDSVQCPPLVLTGIGRRELLLRERLVIAIVGTRTPTPYGVQHARAFAFDMASRGIVIASGYARGIDREAHRAALDAGGDTIAILGSGLLTPYPGDQPSLFDQIRERGLILSEFPLLTQAAKAHFPRRNRILAGISNATLVIEAGGASGSLITARWAIDQGREIFVMPGRIDSPMSAGCHTLLREGAWVASSIADLQLDFESLFGMRALSRWGVRSAGLTATPVRFPTTPVGATAGVQAAALAPGGFAARSLDTAGDRARARLVERAASGASLEELAQVWEGPPDDLFEAIVGLELAGRLERGPQGLLRAALTPRGP